MTHRNLAISALLFGALVFAVGCGSSAPAPEPAPDPTDVDVVPDDTVGEVVDPPERDPEPVKDRIPSRTPSRRRSKMSPAA